MANMRRKDRQTSEFDAWKVVEMCQYAVISMIDEDGSPYCVPVNIVRDGNRIYFHSATVGKKAIALRMNPRVCINCVTNAEVVQSSYTTLFDSATLFGTVQEVEDTEERLEAMRKICLRHAPDHMERFEASIARSFTNTAIWRVTVESITGKRNR